MSQNGYCQLVDLILYTLLFGVGRWVRWAGALHADGAMAMCFSRSLPIQSRLGGSPRGTSVYHAPFTAAPRVFARRYFAPAAAVRMEVTVAVRAVPAGAAWRAALLEAVPGVRSIFSELLYLDLKSGHHSFECRTPICQYLDALDQCFQAGARGGIPGPSAIIPAIDNRASCLLRVCIVIRS